MKSSYESELKSEYLKRVDAQENEEYVEVYEQLIEMGVPEEEIKQDGPYAVVLGVKLQAKSMLDGVNALQKDGYWWGVNSPADIYAVKARDARVDPGFLVVARAFAVVLIVVAVLVLVL